MTEGSDEKALVDVLIEKGMLKFDIKELLYEQVFHKRQIDDELLSRIMILPHEDKVVVFRVGDKLSDKFDIRKKDIPNKIIDVKKICTLPELEMLFIINEHLLDEFTKNKSSSSPSEFYKSKNKKYKKQAAFVKEYFENMSVKQIKQLLKRYSEKRGKVHSKDEHTLLDLVK